MSFAQLPSHWLHDPKKDSYTLAELHWRDHRAGGIAALLVLLVLAVRLNVVGRAALKAGAKIRPDTVSVTWDELQTVTGFARATVGKAILLLESWGAIEKSTVGRKNIYRLIDVHKPGRFCLIPLGWIEKDGDPVSRFKNLPATLVGLNALKLYFVLLTLRNTKIGTTSLSYNGITRWTGIRREDIRKAWGYLDGQQLATVTFTRDERHNRFTEDDQSQRYVLIGLTNGYTRDDVQLNDAYEGKVPQAASEDAL
jgi:hypothetical protein